MFEEFPCKRGLEDLLEQVKKYGRLKQDSIVTVTSSHGDRYFTAHYWLPGVSTVRLGELKIPRIENTTETNVFQGFLNKFSKEQGFSHGQYWHIEYGILHAAYQCFKRNPQELEQILKVAKTKKDLKIHLGVS